MTNPNIDTPPENESTAPQPIDTRRRLRELLSIPERDRTDEQWDEIIELEIQLAPGNRISPNEQPGAPSTGRSGPPQSKNAGPGLGAGQQKKHRPRTNNNNRRPRQPKPQSGGNGGGTPAA